MTNDEKIRLVLETLGVDNVRQATKELRNLKDAAEEVGKTTKKGFDPSSLLVWGQAIDDIQYGIRGILNNIPQLVNSFGGGAAAAGGFQIALIALNFAFDKLGSLIDDTTPKVKPFAEQLDGLTKSGSQTTAQVDALAESAKKLATAFGPGMIESFDKTVARMGDIVKTMKEAQALQKEIAQENAAREKGQGRIDEKGKQGDAGSLFGEFFGGMSEDEAIALRDRVAKDSRQRAESELVDSEMSALEGAGTWAGLKYRTMTGAQSPAQKRLEAQSKAQYRDAIRKRIGRDGSLDKQAQSIASGLIEEAIGGDPRAIQRMRDAGGFGEFEQYDQADKAFFGGLSDRSAAIKNRNERRAKLAGELANNPPLPPDMERRRMEAAAIAAGEKTGAMIGPNGAMFDAELNRRALAAQAKSEAEMAKEAAIRNQVLGMADPAQMAAARMYQASQFGPGRNRVLKQLQERDTNIYANALSERGMSPAAAQDAAQESIVGGNRQFAEFADSIGKNLGSNLRAQEAAAQYMMRMGTNVDENTARLEALTQQLNASGAGELSNVRPQLGRARN